VATDFTVSAAVTALFKVSAALTGTSVCALAAKEKTARQSIAKTNFFIIKSIRVSANIKKFSRNYANLPPRPRIMAQIWIKQHADIDIDTT
jgi:hypothetical protein